MRVDWDILRHDGRSCEAQVWAPDAGSERAILFCSGFPGRGATIFEQRHATALVEAGYTLVVIRHAGTRLEGPDAPFMINNAARLRRGDGYIGGAPSSVADWLWEPYTALGAISPRYKDVRVIGNSFGAVSMLWSMTRAGATLKDVRMALCYAGAQGIDADPVGGIMRVWNPVFLANPVIAEKVAIDDPMSISNTMREAYRDIPDKVRNLPATIALKYLVVDSDEILNPADTQAFIDVTGRGEMHLSHVDKAYPAFGLLAHDTPDFPTHKLLELLQ